MASPSARPTPSSSPTLSPADRRTVKFMLIRQAKATMNQTMAQTSERLRPR